MILIIAILLASVSAKTCGFKDPSKCNAQDGCVFDYSTASCAVLSDKTVDRMCRTYSANCESLSGPCKRIVRDGVQSCGVSDASLGKSVFMNIQPGSQGGTVHISSPQQPASQEIQPIIETNSASQEKQSQAVAALPPAPPLEPVVRVPVPGSDFPPKFTFTPPETTNGEVKPKPEGDQPAQTEEKPKSEGDQSAQTEEKAKSEPLQVQTTEPQVQKEPIQEQQTTEVVEPPKEEPKAAGLIRHFSLAVTPNAFGAAQAQ